MAKIKNESIDGAVDVTATAIAAIKSACRSAAIVREFRRCANKSWRATCCEGPKPRCFTLFQIWLAQFVKCLLSIFIVVQEISERSWPLCLMLASIHCKNSLKYSKAVFLPVFDPFNVSNLAHASSLI